MNQETTAQDIAEPALTGLLQDLKQRGVELTSSGGALRFRAPEGVMTSELKTRIRAHRDQLLALLSNTPAPGTGTPASDGSFPTTDIQAAYLVGRSRAFEAGGTGCHGYAEFALDPESISQDTSPEEALELAWEKVVANHPMLKAQFSVEGTQWIDPELQVPLQIRDATERRQVRETLRSKNYPISGAPLLDAIVTRGTGEWLLHLSIDLLISDFQGLDTLVRELDQVLAAPSEPLDAPSMTFREYQERLLIDPDHQKRAARDREYWSKRAGNLPDPLLLSPRMEPSPSGYRRRSHRFGANDSEALEAAARALGVTPTALLVALVGKVLRRFGDGNAGSIAMTLASRWPLAPDVDRIVGDFTSTVLIGLPGDAISLEERISGAHRDIFEALSHSGISGVEIARMAARAKGIDRFITPVVVTSTLGVGSGGTAALRLLRPLPDASISQTPQVLLDIQFSQSGGGLAIDWDCREDGFEPAVLDAAFADFVKLLTGIAGTGSIDGADPLRSPEHVKRTEGRRCGIHVPFLEHALREPGRMAVIDAGRTWTRGQLAAAANHVAGWLRDQGHDHSPVIVNLPPGIHQLVMHIGILWAGGAYVPVEPDWPSGRLENVAQQVATWWQEPLEISRGSGLLEEIDAWLVDPVLPGDWASCEVDPDLVAYVIFTSGSTGSPKGVVVTHAQAMTTLHAMTEQYRLGESDAVLAVSRQSFDLSVFNEFGLLGAGGRIVIPSSGNLTDQRCWLEEITRHDVTVWNSVPAQLELLITEYEDGSHRPHEGVRLVLLSGDWVPVGLPERTWRALPNTRFVALGGATEAAIWSNRHEVTEPMPPDARSVPYGTALPNQGIWVLNADDEPAATGQIGRIVIGGDGVANGYAGSEELTRAAFFTHPGNGERCYRTGDLGRMLPNGEIEFLGRSDRQVKIRGHRIELGEIEAVLAADPRIASAIAVVTDSGAGGRIGVAVVPDDPGMTIRATEPAAAVTAAARRCLTETTTDPALERSGDLHRRLDSLAEKHMLLILGQALGLPRGQAADFLGVSARHHLYRWLNHLERVGLISWPEGRLAIHRAPSPEEMQKEWRLIRDLSDGTRGQLAVLDYVGSCLEQLPRLLKGEADPLALLFPRGEAETARATYQSTPAARWSNALVAGVIAEQVHHINSAGRTARLLEIGAGTGGTTEEVLSRLADADYEYLFTDVSRYFLDTAEQRWPQVSTAIFDINSPEPPSRVTEPKDVILAANVLHNSRDIAEALDRINSMLAPGGIAVIIDSTSDSPLLMTTMEFKEGLGNNLADSRRETASPFLNLAQWQKAIEGSALELLVQAPTTEQPELDFGHQHVFILRTTTGAHELDASVVREIAATKLPGYMVPDIVTVLDELPLTANGKVDRKVVLSTMPRTTPEPTGVEGPVPELSALESRAAGVWRKVLGLPDSQPLAPESNFFDLGGDSLLLSRCVAQLRRELPDGESFPWDTVFQTIVASPTVATCASAFSKERTSSAPAGSATVSSPLVQLSDSDGWEDESRVVFVHDGSGGLAPYSDLLAALSAGAHPELTGLVRRPGDGFVDVAPESRLDALADRYLSALGTDERPCHLVGYCLGGLVAAALAVRLAAADLPVASLTAISSYRIPFTVEDDLLIDYAFARLMFREPADAGIRLDDTELGQALTLARRSTGPRITRDSLLAAATPGLRAALTAAPPGKEQRLGLLARAMGNHGIDELQALRANVVESLEAVAAWQSEPYLGDIDFIRQEGRLHFLPELSQDMTEFWQQHCLGELRIHDVPGTHFTCLTGSRAPGVARLLREVWGRRS